MLLSRDAMTQKKTRASLYVFTSNVNISFEDYIQQVNSSMLYWTASFFTDTRLIFHLKFAFFWYVEEMFHTYQNFRYLDAIL